MLEAVRKTYYKFPEDQNVNSFIQKMKKEFPVSAERKKSLTEKLYDTFDWRLFNKKMLVHKLGAKMYLSVADFIPEPKLNENAGSSIPRFWYDFKNDRMRSRLKPLLGPRALVEICTLKRDIKRHKILNIDGKTTAFLDIISYADERNNETLLFAAVEEMRGYAAEYEKLNQYCRRAGLVIQKRDPVVEALAACGREPGEYSSKLNIKLRPDDPVLFSVRNVLQFLSRVISENLDGIKRDIDIEYLHDYRVAVRRTRAVLGQLVDALPEGTADKYKKKFAELGKRTNRLRDFDVYLQKQKSYYKKLPGFMEPGLNDFFNFLAAERKKEFVKVKSFLSTKGFSNFLEEWDKYLASLNESSIEKTKKGSVKTIETAAGLIKKKYEKIIKSGNSIIKSGKAEKLHKLRIECKKLRYLLEFFASLYPKSKMNKLIGSLKKLQDYLGDFNDLHVEVKTLKDFLEMQGAVSKKSIQRAAALGGLITAAYHKQDYVFSMFSNTWADFDSSKTSTVFNDLFNK